MTDKSVPTMPEPEVMELLVQNACSASDIVAMDSELAGDTGAETTRKVLARALEALVANGLIRVVHPDDWPGYFLPSPPYTDPFKEKR